METRKITIVSTKDQSKKVIMTNASTLGELKEALTSNNIDYTDMAFYEGISKVELKTDSSILPHDVPWKGATTNELVFMLTTINNKIKSGAMDRLEIYNKIKELGLQEECFEKYGKNFTTCKTADLMELLDNACDSADMLPKSYASCVDINARKAIIKLLEAFKNGSVVINSEDKEFILRLLNVDNSKNKNMSPYSDDEIDDMFSDIHI